MYKFDIKTKTRLKLWNYNILGLLLPSVIDSWSSTHASSQMSKHSSLNKHQLSVLNFHYQFVINCPV